MSIATGSRLGPYEVTGPLGASWNGKPFELFQVGTSGPGSRNVGLAPGDAWIADTSPAGKALVLSARPAANSSSIARDRARMSRCFQKAATVRSADWLLGTLAVTKSGAGIDYRTQL